MYKAVGVLKLFFSLLSLNSTEWAPASSRNSTNTSSLPATNTPVILKQMNRLSAEIGQASRFQISDDKYYNIHELQLELLTINRGKIPPSSWLRFDEERRAIFVFPLPGNKGVFHYLLVAQHKKSNKEEVEKIEIHVREQKRKLNHEVVLETNFNFLQFSTDVMTRFDFARKMARYCVHRDPSGVWLKSYDKEAKTVTVSFNTLEYTPCNLEVINSIKSRMVDNNARVKSAFQKALSSRFMVTDVSINLIGPCDPNKEPDSGKFDWGIWKHVLPPLILIVIVGVPVSISCVVRRSRPKRRVAGESKAKRGRLGRKKGNREDFGFHTVHFNNRYPSMLSVSANSKEDENADIPNGSPSNLSPRVVKNCSGKLPNGLGNSVTNKQKCSKNLTENGSKKKDVYIGKSELNIPCYYNFDPNQPQEPAKSALDSTFESFGEFAGAISSKLKDIKDVAGKSVINVSSIFGQNMEEETAKDVKTNNPEMELQYLNSASVETKTGLRNNQVERPDNITNTTLQTSQYSGEVYENSITRTNMSRKEQTPNATCKIVKTEDQMSRDTDLMQHVLERMSVASAPLPQHNGQMPIVSAISQNYKTPNTFGQFQNVEDHTTNALDQLYDMNVQLHNATGYIPNTRAQNVNRMDWDPRFRSHESDLLLNHIPYSNMKQYQSQFALPNIHHGTVRQAQLRKSQTYHGGFITLPRRKMSVYEPPDIHRLHPSYSQLNRSRSELSLNCISSNLEQSRVLSKSDLCLYQSNNEFSPYSDYEDNGIRSELSFYHTNDGGYSIENEVYESHASAEHNASEYVPEYVLPEANAMSCDITLEHNISYFPPTESLTSPHTMSVYTMPDQVMSSHVSSAHIIPEYGRSSFDATELPVFTVDDYGLAEPFGRSLHRNQMNQNTTKSMLALPVMTRGNGTQYEFGFTPASSHEDTTSPRGTYHEYINPLPSPNGPGRYPAASISNTKGTTYNSGGAQYQQVQTDYHWDEEEYETDNRYQRQPDAYGTFANSMPNLADKQHGYSANTTGWNNTSRKQYTGHNKDEERSLLTKVFGSEKITESGVAEDVTVVGFLKTKVSSFLG